MMKIYNRESLQGKEIYMLKRILFISILLCFLITSLFAQNVFEMNNFESSVRADVVAVKAEFNASVKAKPGKPSNPKPKMKYIKVLAVAYCIHGRTATGTRTKYGTIAVDPKVIPYGTKIYVPGYGWGIASDCGGGISGNMVDLWFPTYSQCINWGSRYVKIGLVKK